MVVEQFKKLWLPRGVDFMIVPELSADHCMSAFLPPKNISGASSPSIGRVAGDAKRAIGARVLRNPKFRGGM